MITSESFLSGTLNTVDNVIGHFVDTAYEHLIQANSTVITMLFTLYVMFLGYRFLTRDHHFHLTNVMKHIILMMCVYGLIMKWDLYNLFVYQIFTNEPGNIANVLIKAANGTTSGTSIAEALDNIFWSVLNASKNLFSQIGLSASSFAFGLYAFLVLVVGSLMCIFALLLFIYAKMMMAVALALGPIFILFILWEPTKGLFTAWLNNLITLALIPIVTSAILVLMLSVIQVTLPSMNQPVDQMQFYGIVPFLGLTLATTMILFQVFRICSVLGGGITLTSISMGNEIAHHAFHKSGVAKASKGVMNLAHNSVRKLQRRIMRKSP